ncbi:MAG: PASTA domain-containing protein [Solobacterium sp.]|nr:PASTA domain-containing protein [Solobacterium sp.]
MKNRTQRVVRMISIITLVVMLVLASNVFLVSINKLHLRSGTDLSAYADSANTVRTVTKALRGNIYDRNNTIIAQDNRTYNIVCILYKDRPSIKGTITYVQDKEGTAAALSKILRMDYEQCLAYLNQDVYQTELGMAGRNLSQATMEEIRALNLPGIEFTDSIQRAYPLGTFASNLFGFAQSDETGSTIGRMGTELYLDDYLRGEDGYRIYQADKDGHILPGMKEETISPINGYDVYTTIDQEIQDALEESFEITNRRFNANRVWGAVMEIKTGEILAWGQSPSFDPNTLNIEDYNNYGAQLPYEPGSTLKTFTYAAAINEGVYDGSALSDSGPFCFTSDDNNNPIRTQEKGWGCIYNAGRHNYGMIEYDYGLIMSLNTVTAEVQNTLINPDIHLQYMRDFGFFEPVRTDGLPEETGFLNYRWPADKLALSYGQGSTVTMLQMLQAYSAVFGDGKMVRPYYIESIKDPYDANHVLYQAETKVTGEPITEETAASLREILYGVFNDERGTARFYQIPECEMLGKTGTAEVAAGGGYASGHTIVSVMAALPADNPVVEVYYCFEAVYDPGAQQHNEGAINLMRKTAIRLGIAGQLPVEELQDEIDPNQLTEIITSDMPVLTNHSMDYANEKLKDLNVNIYQLGAGNTIINQYPSGNAPVSTGQKVFLTTETNSFTMPDLTGWTRKEVTALWSVTQFGFKLTGDGRVIEQNIPPGTVVTKGTEIEVVFE